jgi:SAM-dependent methyltransferase
MQHTDYTQANRRAWNEVAPIHAQYRFEELLAGFQQPGYSTLDSIITEILMGIGLAGKSVVQLPCNNGRELLSIKNLGAERCVGFDIAEHFLAQAEQLVAASGIAGCTFVHSDVYDVPEAYHGQFDLVAITIGSFGWLPDLAGFFQVLRRLLRSGGWLVIYEEHPVMAMFEPAPDETAPVVRHSYFRTEPFVDEDGLDYYGYTRYAASPHYWFQHKLSDIMTACLNVGLRLTAFQEYDHDISRGYRQYETMPKKLPMSYSLVARVAE